MSKEQPQNIVEWYALYQQNWPVDVKGLCRNIGVECIGESLSDDQAGRIQRVKLNGNCSYQIIYNLNHQAIRQRFSIAHMLGHYYMHRMKLLDGVSENKCLNAENRLIDNSYISQENESEANAFVADLIMPKAAIHQLNEEGLSFEQVADTLGVQAKMLHFRCQKFDLDWESSNANA